MLILKFKTEKGALAVKSTTNNKYFIKTEQKNERKKPKG